MSKNKELKSIAKSMKRIIDILELDLQIKQSETIIHLNRERRRNNEPLVKVPDYRTGGVNDRD